MAEQELKLSIVVPVYNVEEYLEDCLNSLLDQDVSKEEYEIICVNDGSTDGSLNILEEYVKKHSNIVLVTQKNSGVSTARNTGIERSQGKYLMFCDSDDMLKSGVLNSILKAMEYENVNTFNFSYLSFRSKSDLKEMKKCLTYETNQYRYTTPNVWSWIFDNEIVRDNHLFFNEKIKYGEDTLFTCKYVNALNGKQWLKSDDKIYMYRIREGSAMTGKSSQKAKTHLESMLLMAEEYKNMSNMVDAKIKTEIKHRQAMCVANAMYDAMRIKDINPKKFLYELKEKELYPYPLLLFTLKFVKGNIRGCIVNYIKFLFPFRWYYLLVCKLHAIVKNKK